MSNEFFELAEKIREKTEKLRHETVSHFASCQCDTCKVVAAVADIGDLTASVASALGKQTGRLGG